jgi:hypothetical protein
MCKNNQNSSEKQDKLLFQLHEQYAINNNSSMGAVISLLVSMFAAIGAYGYVWTHCGLSPKDFGLADLTFSAIGATLILLIMSYICMYQGASQRLEQFITYKIRMRFGLVDFFPAGYEPYGKKGLQVVQGLYGEFVKIFTIVAFFVLISFLLKAKELHDFQCDCKYTVFAILGFMIYLGLNSLFLSYNIHRYGRRCKDCKTQKT